MELDAKKADQTMEMMRMFMQQMQPPASHHSSSSMGGFPDIPSFFEMSTTSSPASWDDRITGSSEGVGEFTASLQFDNPTE